ncbi:MAG TPA: hypothetical protein VLV89_00785 [Candidatus Acidoferrum sp.]|nr:hypothetical protein [Candidatus Acidoferrum sp.]
MRRYIAGTLLVLGIVASTAWGDDFWVKKSWKEWTKSDCKKLLEDSPWAKRFTVENTSTVGSMPSASHDAASTSGPSVAGSGVIEYHVQIRSAEPIRQAIIRQDQLANNYDKMSEEEKKGFDAKEEEQFSKFQGDVIAFHVLCETNAALQPSLTVYWQSFPEGTFPEDLYVLGDGGAKIPPVIFISKAGRDTEFDAVFPRSPNGQPLVAPGAKSIKFQFKNPKLGDFSAKVVNAEFKLDKMNWNGKPEF